MSFDHWLREVGLERYAAVLAENDIDFRVAHALSEADLKELGFTLGHRKLFMAALTGLRAQSQPATADSDHAAEAPASAERRQLTVLFCDLVGSTALSERLDPEELRALIQAYRRTCAQVIARYEGHIARYVGDGILSYFGWPAAHEEDPERAIRAALELVQAVKRVAAAEPLAVHIGIATGPVVVGQEASEAAEAKLAVGVTPNLAARLQGLAAADQVVIAAATRKLVGETFELIDLGAQELKGIAEPLRAWRVEGVRQSEDRFEATRAASHLTPLVGREEEIALLLRRWQQAKAGDGQVVLLGGEPGIGKSRIIQELRARISAEPHTRLRYQCSPYHAHSAWYPIITHFEHAADFAPADTAQQKLDKLEAFLRRASEHELAPQLFAAMLSLPIDRYPALQFSLQRQKEETLKALGEQLRGLALSQPVLFLFEDAHWSDPTTVEVLDLVVGLAPDLRMLAIITFRPEFQPAWIGQSHVALLALNRLTRSQAAALTAEVTGGKPLPGELLDLIVAKTDGVPLFVEELTRMVIESAMVSEANGRYILSGPLSELAIPSTLQDSLMARLDRLSSGRQVAQWAACVGREFDRAVLGEIGTLSDADLGRALDRLVEADIISGRGPSYVFKHALLRDAAYQSLLNSERRALHTRIAGALERRAETAPELLAHHWTEAGDLRRAAPCWLRAGRDNVRRSANAEAIRYFERALGAIRQLQDSEDTRSLELDVQLAYIPALMAIAGYTDRRTVAAANRAYLLCEEFGAAARALPVLFAQLSSLTASAQIAPALKFASRILQLGERDGDAMTRFVGYRTVGFCQFQMGNLEAGEDALETALELGEPLRRPDLAFEYGHDLMITGGVVLSMAKSRRGFPAQSERMFAAATDAAMSLGHAFTLAYVLMWRTMSEALGRSYARLEQTSAVYRELCERHGFDQHLHSAELFHLWASSTLSNKGALADLERSLDQHRRGPVQLSLPFNLMLLADACLRYGEVKRAEELLDEALAICERSGEKWLLPELHILMAEVKQAGRADAESERWLRTALEIAVRQRARAGELRAATLLARLLARQGRGKQASDLLAPVYAWFTEGFDTPDLKEAKALLDELRA